MELASKILFGVTTVSFLVVFVPQVLIPDMVRLVRWVKRMWAR